MESGNWKIPSLAGNVQQIVPNSQGGFEQQPPGMPWVGFLGVCARPGVALDDFCG